MAIRVKSSLAKLYTCRNKWTVRSCGHWEGFRKRPQHMERRPTAVAAYSTAVHPKTSRGLAKRRYKWVQLKAGLCFANASRFHLWRRVVVSISGGL